MSIAHNPLPPQPIDLPQLEKRLRSPRTFISALLSVITGLMTFMAMVPLFSVLIMLIWHCVAGFLPV